MCQLALLRLTIESPDELDEKSPMLRTESLFVYKNLSILSSYETCADFLEKYLNAHTNFQYRQMTHEELKTLRLDKDPSHIPYRDWIRHLLSVTKSPLMLLLAVVYLRKALAPQHQDLRVPTVLRSLTIYNRHRVLLVSMILAGKYLMDNPYSMSVWSKFGQNYWGVKELGHLEIMMLRAMKWNLFVKPEDFRDFLSQEDISKKERISELGLGEVPVKLIHE
eukprot:TRINITY_DN4161_c0_g1::TRINITY_DN4161_c0_g1_i1::g.2015::m.2015 TRINITY_DN4161_c0_g1::TRINITY_DN4161_c0_g1_i1::g.2015  ORF type:complete len:222 (+),score=27.22,Cyclin/PF08613.6/6.7e-09,Cyclin_N/PF00134.18/1.6e-05 TRINITY_DN4161_c0_g1_i1:135-800(+)